MTALVNGAAVPSLIEFLHYMLPSFLLGVLVGAVGALRLRHSGSLGMKEKDMDEPKSRSPIRRAWAWWEAFTRDHGTAVTALCVLLVAGCIAGLTWQIQVNSAQDRRRTSDNTAFIKCFDQFATDLAGSLPPVRDATQKRDQLTEARDKAAVEALTGDHGLRGALEKAAAGTFQPSDMNELLKQFAVFQKAAAKVTAANADLQKARTDNPYPAAPSKICKLP